MLIAVYSKAFRLGIYCDYGYCLQVVFLVFCEVWWRMP